ncbi:uncharacterized protein LOC117754066 [Hippoglossus hippoglossus]|uniref:uncharacterized protein LOC117754066 n=1 Tax=Hippoglossus hippoglossus TaxID=8267 RepID=UPI00148D6BF9|nr:uncharacterized protein LOC117754066 [Hippoglossus hippoglossus]
MMAAELLLLLLCAGAGLHSAEAQDLTDELPDAHMQGVDLAFEQLNLHSGVQHHFRFLKTVVKSEIAGGFTVRYIYHHFYMKPTTCPKGTTELDPLNCPFRHDRPLMDCAVCYKMAAEQIEPNPKPYVNCIQKPRLTKQMRMDRLENCKKMSYNSGAPTLLSSRVR